jgi:hypothetical protein
MRPYMWPSSGKRVGDFGSRQMVPAAGGSSIAGFLPGWTSGQGVSQMFRGGFSPQQVTGPPAGWRGPPGHVPGVFRQASVRPRELRPFGQVPQAFQNPNAFSMPPGLGLALLPWLTGVGQYQPGGPPAMPWGGGPGGGSAKPVPSTPPVSLADLAAFAAQYQTGY